MVPVHWTIQWQHWSNVQNAALKAQLEEAAAVHEKAEAEHVQTVQQLEQQTTQLNAQMEQAEAEHVKLTGHRNSCKSLELYPIASHMCRDALKLVSRTQRLKVPGRG